MSENSENKELRSENDMLRNQLAIERMRSKELLEELELKRNLLAESHQELTDSVNYAKRIQEAIMPPLYYVRELLPDSFVFYLPKDVVSGDFFFVEQVENKIVFSAVDCTGHGVPGALISVVGFSCLDQAVREHHMSRPSEILAYLDEGVNDKLRQTLNESGVYDSMDLGLCTLDMDTKELQFAGSYNPVWYYSQEDEVLVEIKADKLPIGVNEDGVVDVFTNHKVQLQSGDTVYVFSDGFADQFGGPRGKKYKYGPFKDLIMRIQDRSMEDQLTAIQDEFYDWKGPHDQIDDILIMGVRVP